MDTRKNIKGMLIIFTAMFVVLSVYLVYTLNTYGTRWFSSPYNTRLNAQKNRVIAGDILDRTGKKLATTNSAGDRIYVDDSTMRRATAHVVGDNYGQTFGAENFFSKYLLGFEQGFFESITQSLTGKPGYGDNVVLTLNAELNDYAYRRMGDFNGAIIVMNYKTGEIYASVSKPTFDPKYVAEYLNGKRTLEDGAMVNRVTSGRYTPGSVFKIVTTLAAIRYIPNVGSRVFNCDGPLAFDAKSGKLLRDVHIPEDEATEAGKSGDYLVVRDYNKDYHGGLNLSDAFSKSCNHVFATLAVEIGSDRLIKVAKELGVTDEFLFSDMVSSQGSIEKAKTDWDTAWMGVGQYKDIVTPVNMCMIVAGIANGGTMVEPKILYDVKSRNGISSYNFNTTVYKKPYSLKEAELLKELMVKTVESGTGRNAKVSGYVVAGKTGTAEVSAGDKKPNAWFAGFIDSDEHPIAICVVLEEGGSGGGNAAPIAGKVLSKAMQLGL